jgi:hypothetical protein
MVGWPINDESEIIWKEAVMTNIKSIPGILLEDWEKPRRASVTISCMLTDRGMQTDSGRCGNRVAQCSYSSHRLNLVFLSALLHSGSLPGWLSTLKIEVIGFSEKSHVRTTRCYIPGNGNIHNYLFEILKSYRSVNSLPTARKSFTNLTLICRCRRDKLNIIKVCQCQSSRHKLK